MANYNSTIVDGKPIIFNAKTGEIIKSRISKNGRRTVKLYYNGKAHTHTLAHAFCVLEWGLQFKDCKYLDAHHINGKRLDDRACNYEFLPHKLHIMFYHSKSSSKTI